MATDTLLIVTARNEAERLGATLAALTAAFPAASVWVADDGSTDATAAIARAAGAVVSRSERPLGKGGAATKAARAALTKMAARAERTRSAFLDEGAAEASGKTVAAGGETVGGDGETVGGETVVILCDGDLGESAGRLGPLAEAVRDGAADLAVAAFARRAGGGFGLAVGFARWAIHRRCGLRLRAPISGQRALRAGALEEVLPFADGFGMELAMTIDAARAGLRVREVDLDLEHRATGRTLGGFLHRARQLADFIRVYRARS